MATILQKTILSIPGVKLDVDPSESLIENEDEPVTFVDFDFSFRDVRFKANQYLAEILNINVISTVFAFPTSVEYSSSIVFRAVNEFNLSKPGLKCALHKKTKESLAIKFSVDFMCPDRLLNDDVLHSAIIVLRNSGQIFLRLLEGQGSESKPVKGDE